MGKRPGVLFPKRNAGPFDKKQKKGTYFCINLEKDWT